MASSTTLHAVLSILIITMLVPSTAEASALVREIPKLKQFVGTPDTLPGLNHITLAGVVRDGMKEVEVWIQTLIPGQGTPIHRHDCEEILIIVKGGGTVYLAPEIDDSFPGEPVATPFSTNSTVIIPVNSVHQVVNTNDEDLQFYVVVTRLPFQAYVYKDWTTNHDDVVPLYPIPWYIPEEATPTNDEL